LFWSYRTYYQEKLVHMDECCVGSLKKVYDKYVDHLWKGWDL
jgi:hypothetical protein